MIKENNDERQTMVYKILHKKLKSEETIFHLKSDVDASALGGLAVPAPSVVSIVVLINDTSMIL
jgi:hypothetical protein